MLYVSVTGINTEVVVTVMYIVCIFYTTIVSISLEFEITDFLYIGV